MSQHVRPEWVVWVLVRETVVDGKGSRLSAVYIQIEGGAGSQGSFI